MNHTMEQLTCLPAPASEPGTYTGPERREQPGSLVLSRSNGRQDLSVPDKFAAYLEGVRADQYMLRGLADALPPLDENWPDSVKERYWRLAEVLVREVEA